MRPFRYRFTLANTTRQNESRLAHRVGESFVVCHLADAHGLCGNAEACTVHEGHHVLDETELAAAAEFSLGVLVDKFASRASVNTELVFDAANVNATVLLRPLGSYA